MILYLVDEGLRMLHTNSQRKALRLNLPSLAVEHLVDIPCGVSCGKNHFP